MVPLPESITTEIKNHLACVIGLHEEDLRAGYPGTFLPSLLEKKYKNAATELAWQWFFPNRKKVKNQHELTKMPEYFNQIIPVAVYIR